MQNKAFNNLVQGLSVRLNIEQDIIANALIQSNRSRVVYIPKGSSSYREERDRQIQKSPNTVKELSLQYSLSQRRVYKIKHGK